MKLAICSDLHLEFKDIILKNDEAADVLILSGDICTAKSFSAGQKQHHKKLYTDFFKRATFQFPQVVYVMGNHEHYNYDVAWTEDTLKEQLAFPNLHILENKSIDINEVTFVGATLWTDMNKEDPVTLYTIKGKMNDFNVIKNSNNLVHHKHTTYKIQENGTPLTNDYGLYRVIDKVNSYTKPSQWSPEDSVEAHKKTLTYFDEATKDTSKTYVVVGHHAPTHQSIAECFKHDALMNGAFASDLSEFILNRPQIALWTHGHMHDQSDYMVGDTRVVCNPRGYVGYETRAKEFQLQYIDI